MCTVSSLEGTQMQVAVTFYSNAVETLVLLMVTRNVVSGLQQMQAAMVGHSVDSL